MLKFNPYKRLAAAFAFVLLTSVILIGLSVAFNMNKSHSKVISSDTEITSVLTSSQDACIYLGEEDGKIIKRFSNGETAVEVVLSKQGNRIQHILETPDGVLAVDEAREAYLINSEGTVISQMTLPGIFVKADWSDGVFYIGMTSDYSDFYIFKYDSKFTKLGSGKFYLYNKDSEKIEAANVAVHGLYVHENDIFIVSERGYVYKSNIDLSRFTNNTETFFNAEFEEAWTENAIVYADYDRQNNEFYIAGKNKNLYKINGETLAVEKDLVKFPQDVGFIRFISSTNELFVGYSLFNNISVYDASSMQQKYDFVGEFNISTFEVSSDGSGLFMLNKSGGYNYLNYINVDGLKKQITYHQAALTYLIVGIAFAVAAVFLGVCVCSSRFRSSVSKKGKTILKSIWKQKFIYIVFLPSLILLFLFCYYPTISSLVMAFFDYRMGYPVIFTGLSNFSLIFSSPGFTESMKNMVIFLVFDLIFALGPPIVFAMCLCIMRNKKLSSLSRMLLFIPGILPGITGILIWKNGIYGEHGVINNLIKLSGGSPIAFLGDYMWSMPSLILMGFPFVGSYLIFYGALINIPKDYYEAAEISGCGLFRRIRKIDMPLIMGQIKYVFIMTFIGSVQNIGRVLMTTQGAAGTQIPINIMYNYLSDNNYGASAAMALMMMLLLLAATIMNLRIKSSSD